MLTDTLKRKEYDQWRLSGIVIPYKQWVEMRKSTNVVIQLRGCKKCQLKFLTFNEIHRFSIGLFLSLMKGRCLSLTLLENQTPVTVAQLLSAKLSNHTLRNLHLSHHLPQQLETIYCTDFELTKFKFHRFNKRIM